MAWALRGPWPPCGCNATCVESVEWGRGSPPSFLPQGITRTNVHIASQDKAILKPTVLTFDIQKLSQRQALHM